MHVLINLFTILDKRLPVGPAQLATEQSSVANGVA